jgi:hypothetical protein
VRATNEKSQFGGVISRGVMVGDMNVYGRFYFGNSGIGLIYGDIDTSSGVEKISVSETNLATIGNSQFHVTFNILTEKTLSYRIINISGVTVASGVIFGSASLGDKLNSGTYILELKDKISHETQITKLIKF